MPLMTTDAPRERAIELSEAARASPGDVDRSAVLELLAADDADARRYAIQAFRAADWPASELSAVVTRLESSLDDDDAMLRNSALQALTDVAARDVELVESVVEDPATLLEDESDLVQSSAVELLFFVAKADPDAVVDAVPNLIERFDPETLAGRRGPLFCLAAVARERPDPFVDHVDVFVDAFLTTGDEPTVDTGAIENPVDRERISDAFSNAGKQRRTHRTVAGDVVVNVAQSSPAAVRHRLDDIAAVADDADPQIQGVVVDVFGALAVDHPEAVIDHLPTLAARLADPPSVRRRAVQALAALSQSRPEPVVEAIEPYAAELVGALDAEEPTVRSAGAGLLSYLAERDPEAASPAREPARMLLDDDHAFVRGNAVWLLGAVGDASDRERLAELRDSDPDPDVREAATTVLGED